MDLNHKRFLCSEMEHRPRTNHISLAHYAIIGASDVLVFLEKIDSQIKTEYLFYFTFFLNG